MHFNNFKIPAGRLADYLLLSLLCFMLTAYASETLHAQSAAVKPVKNPRIEIVGEIQATKDYFGRQRFIGKVRNMEKVRIDYISIDFIMRNKEGDVIGTVNNFIKGRFHQFQDFQVSTSTLGAGKTGTFDIITHVPADSVYSYKYAVKGSHFLYK